MKPIRRPLTPARKPSAPVHALRALATLSILSGPIYAQVPTVPITRTFDNGSADLTWANPVNWSADTLPTGLDIANFNVGQAAATTINLGGVSWDVLGLLFSANGTAAAGQYTLSSGTIVTNSISQTNDDANALNPTALVTTGTGGTDVLRVNVSSNTLQIQGLVTAGGLYKAGANTLRLGTSGTNFVNAINGDIVLAGGTLTASGTNTATGNPLGGTGNLVARTASTLILDTLDILDFGRNLVATSANLTIQNNRFGGAITNAAQRVGTITVGSTTLRVFHNATSVGFFTGSDELAITSGSTATIQVDTNGRLESDAFSGDATTKVIKTGANELRIRANTASSFAGDIDLREGTLRFDVGTSGSPLVNSSTDITFAALGTLQLRADASSNFAANILFAPGVNAGTVNVDRINTTATAQTLSLGNATLPNGVTLNVTGANTYALALSSLNVAAGATAAFNPSSANITAAALNIPLGATLNKIGASTLTLNTDNSATALGTLNLRAGTVTGTVAGSLGSAPIVVGDTTPNSAGFLAAFSRLNYNVAGASANAAGADVVVVALGVADLNATPAATDIFDIRADGRIQGTTAQLAALTVGSNLFLSPNAIIVHEAPGSATGTVAGLANDAATFYGIAATAFTLPTLGVGTPWKGISGDNAARVVQGFDAVNPTQIRINGGDNNPTTIEATIQGMNNVNLALGSTAVGDGFYQFATTAAGGEKVTLAIRGTLGAGLGLSAGGNVAFEDTAAVSNLAATVDKIVIQGGALILRPANSLGGVPVDVIAGTLDIGDAASLDGNVAVKSGGVILFNDAFQITGSGIINIEGGGKVDMTGGPANLLTSSQPINFLGTGHTVRFSADNITNLNTNVPDAGVTYVVAGGATAAQVIGTSLSVTTSTQAAGLTLQNGVLTNDGTSRALAAPITLNNSNLTVAASRSTSLAVVNSIATTGTITVGSETAIDSRDKNDPNVLRADGLADPYNSSPQVVFVGPFQAGAVNATGTHLAFADASTNITGDLNFQGNVLYLGGGGPLNGGTVAVVRGNLTPRLTDTSGLVANRIADRIILGNNSRVEMSVTSGPTATTTNHEITQPFIIEGQVNPLDKRTFWVDRGTGAATTNVLFNDITLRPGAQLGYQENNTVVRSSAVLDGDATFIRNTDWDIRNVTRSNAVPANVTLAIGQAPAVAGGSNGSLVQSVDGTIGSGITVDLIRGQLLFEGTATLDAIVRTQTAALGGDSFVVSRSSGSVVGTTFSGLGLIQLGRSLAANGPEDFDVRGTEVTSGVAPIHTVNIPVRIVNDGNNTNIDGIIRSDRHNDSTVIADTQVSTITVDAGATLQTVSVNQARLMLPSITLGAGSAINSTNNTSVFIGEIVGGANPIRFTGQALARITGNVTASAVTVVGAGLDIDPGFGGTTTMNAPVSLSGVISVRTGTLDLGTSVITGAATATVAGLRENKTQGNFDLTTANTSNQIQLGPVMAQLPANSWGENQTVTYTGRIRIPDNGTLGDGIGSIAFAKIFDDSARVQIDGVTVLQSTAFNDAVGSGAIPLPVGLHDIEIRLGQGVGGAGPVVLDGGSFGIGLGIDLADPVDNSQSPGVGNVLDLSQYIVPLDNGSGSLFETTTLKGGINIAGDTTLKAGAFTNLGTINMRGFNSVIGVSANSDAEAVIVATGANSFLSAPSGVGFTFGSLDIADGATLTLTNPPPPAPPEAPEFGGEAGAAAVPEPGSAALLLAGALSLLVRRRRS